MRFLMINLIATAFSLLSSKQISSPRKIKANRALVVYFSCSGNTKRVATNINSIIGGDLIEIVPTEPYTSADLNYGNQDSRVVKEHNDQSILPGISGTIDNFAHYETIYLGYPLWWGQAPNIIRTFMRKYDFSNKNIITFCTSISTSTDSSKSILVDLAPNAKWNDNWQRFRSSATITDVRGWLDGLNLSPSILIIYFSASGNTKRVAEFIQKEKIADIIPIEPEQPYTNADLNWHDESSRVWEEHRNPDLRPPIKQIVSLDKYDAIFIGYPLWWRKAPHVVYTFVESANFAGKTVIPFCTSTSDGIGDSGTDLQSKTTGAIWQAGQRFSENPTEDSVVNWANTIEFTTIDSGDSGDSGDSDGSGDSGDSGDSGNINDDNKILIAYFSATGNTRKVAEAIKSSLEYGRIAEIRPVNPYTSNDLNYRDSNSRVVREHADPSLRPQFNDINDVDKAETVFIGYPLWWREAPHVVYTFIEKYNFNGKTIIPFCTSTSDKIGDSGKNLAAKANGATMYRGQRFESDVSTNKVNDWMKKIIQTDSNGQIKFADKTLSSGLPLGAIIGIAVACVVVVAVVIVVVIVVVRKKRQNKSNAEMTN